MARITVLGGTGYAGGAIAREAAARGHDVVAFSRSAPDADIAGVVPVTGSALVRADLERAVAGAEVIVVALAPSGELEDGFLKLNEEIAELARAAARASAWSAAPARCWSRPGGRRSSRRRSSPSGSGATHA
ncbi:hypothetical protein GCM10020295_04330 [Streptomyces cinereospinus]